MTQDSLNTFRRRCYEIYAYGSVVDFWRSAGRQRYFAAWQRAIAVEHGLYLRDVKQQANWESYCQKETRGD